jgi:hypothetical protein
MVDRGRVGLRRLRGASRERRQLVVEEIGDGMTYPPAGRGYVLVAGIAKSYEHQRVGVVPDDLRRDIPRVLVVDLVCTTSRRYNIIVK